MTVKVESSTDGEVFYVVGPVYCAVVGLQWENASSTFVAENDADGLGKRDIRVNAYICINTHGRTTIVSVRYRDRVICTRTGIRDRGTFRYGTGRAGSRTKNTESRRYGTPRLVRAKITIACTTVTACKVFSSSVVPSRARNPSRGRAVTTPMTVDNGPIKWLMPY